MMGGTSTYLPLKVNQAGVIPIIFATSVCTSRRCSPACIHATWFQNFVNNYVTNSAEHRVHGRSWRC